MASGKLSPRQKMINMMYLVLTALLALQVSSEILHSFETIGDSLRTSSIKIMSKNNDHAGDIKELIESELKQGNRKNEKYLSESELISNKANEMIVYIESLIDSMKAIGQVDKETGKITTLNETEKNYRFWMIGKAGGETANGGRGGGYAKELRERLNAYVDWANEWLSKNKSNAKLQYIALDPSDDPGIDKKNPKNREILSKKWEYVMFHGAPVIANVAILEMLKNDIGNVQTDLLAFLETLVGQVPFKIDSIMAFDAPSSNIVPAGLPFQTKLFVAMSSKQVKPKFSGAGVKADPSGNTATLKAIANASVIPHGKAEGFQSYQATVQVPKADGTMATLTVKGKFKVRKPELQITSGSVLAMYRNCGNDINIDVPALGEYYDPVVSASAAQAIQKPGSKRSFIIVPTADKTTVSVSSKTSGQIIKVGDVTYPVKNPPKPGVILTKLGKKWDGIAAIRSKEEVELRVDADKEFVKALPKDARYKMTSISIKSQIGLSPPETVGTVPASNIASDAFVKINLGQYLRQPRDGTKVIIEVDKVSRVNFQNKEVPEQMSRIERVVSFNVKTN